MQKKKSRAWYEGVCVCRRGELQFAHTTICPHCISPILRIHPCCKFVHIVNSSMLQIRPHRKFIHVANSPMLQIHLCFQLPLMGGRIVHNGWVNCNSPLHMCYPNVGKYTYKSCKYTKKGVMGMV